jgi:hypothetical protein
LFCALAAAPAQAACDSSLAPIFADGFESTPPAQLIVHYPAGAHSITARGNGGGLSFDQGTPMARNGDTFTLSLPLAAPGEWKPVLDDTTFSIGPNYPIAPGQTLEVWPHFTTTQGQVAELIASFQSTLLGNSRPIWAYLPPTYLENTDATFPVIYMNDGQKPVGLAPGAFAVRNNLAGRHRVRRRGGERRVQGGDRHRRVQHPESPQRVHPDLRPGPAGRRRRRRLPANGRAGAQADHRRDAADPHRQGLHHDGGQQPRRARDGVGRPYQAGRVRLHRGILASGLWDGDFIVTSVQSTPAPPNRPLAVYVDAATPRRTTTAHASLLAPAYTSAGYVAGVDFKYVLQAGGQFNETYWAQRFPGAMQFLLGPRDQ